ncbi:hypothetical protein FDC62_10505 [Clostridium botulinum]|uniref:trypsin-like peptidase domain-containing protein n=1 Tax=Clostridium botulinum TaxID=1491 RepID=UPI00052C9DED|nr:trypsin-like peptidase domain-containing protein [Clostridium botulinum]KGM93104.1 hypothetical protein Z956_12275 [Clostridium botulinum D str. CCUG 7971]NFO98618.1 hypothetical protein [Clostridium botulinum]OOV52850.1 hypothetical protein B1A66_02200 [Clostridium botulinum D/C]OOV55830.1 hypothetical protein B0673_07820 [Clostridium botulinum D/C]OOV58208.1 hypothetical protein B1A67_03115 [Clostridium botulinum D/C]
MSNDSLEFGKKVLEICRDDYMDFFNKANVVGIGLGKQVSKRQFTGEKCITVFVSGKFPEDQLAKKDLIPHIYKGIKTDVLPSGPISTCSFTGKIRPVIGGFGISPTTSNEVGSVGCLVKDKNGYYILSNNHVLADTNKIPLGTTIVQPSIKDRGNNPEDVVAKLTKFVPIKFKNKDNIPENYVDAAIAKVINEEEVSSKVAFIGEILGVKPAKLDQSVVKVGRTTEQTFGLVLAEGASIIVEYGDEKAIFKNQIVTTKMTSEGDSGSLLTDSEGYAVGLIYAHSQKHSYHNNISDVLEKLEVTLVTQNM